ncbi:MAG: hypothetical protein VB934_01535, partial [Polyangiaceae bacterium]
MANDDKNGASNASTKQAAGGDAKDAKKKTTKKTAKKSGEARRAPRGQGGSPAVATRSANDRIAIVAGLRTPFIKANSSLRRMRTVDLGVACVKEMMQRSELDPNEVGVCVYGQVVPTVDWLNIAREVVLGAGLPRGIDAYSVSRACATSIQSMTDVAQAILCGQHDVGIAGGADSTTDVPLKVSSRLRDALVAAQRAKTVGKRLRALLTISVKDLLPGQPGFSREPTTGEQMGEAAEKMAKLNAITRERQDEIALASHQNAARAWADGHYSHEVMALIPPPYDS